VSSETPRPGAAHPDRSAPGLGSRLSFATPTVRSSPDYSTPTAGGAGADTFDFDALTDFGFGATRDVINGFAAGADVIDL